MCLGVPELQARRPEPDFKWRPKPAPLSKASSAHISAPAMHKMLENAHGRTHERSEMVIYAIHDLSDPV